MRTSIVLKENRTQLVLESESDHDKEVLKVLAKLPNTKDLVIVFDATPNSRKEEK